MHKKIPWRPCWYRNKLVTYTFNVDAQGKKDYRFINRNNKRKYLYLIGDLFRQKFYFQLNTIDLVGAVIMIQFLSEHSWVFVGS